MIPLMAVADTHIANCANTRDTRNCIPGLCAPSATPTLSMAKRRTKSRGNRRTKTKARQGRKDDGSKPDRSSRDRAQANHQSDAPHHHTKHRSSDASRTSGKQDNKSDSSSSDEGVHGNEWRAEQLQRAAKLERRSVTRPQKLARRARVEGEGDEVDV